MHPPLRFLGVCDAHSDNGTRLVAQVGRQDIARYVTCSTFHELIGGLHDGAHSVDQASELKYQAPRQVFRQLGCRMPVIWHIFVR